MASDDPLALACRELPAVTGRFAELVVSAPDLSVLARGSRWTVREVAVHVAVGARAFADLAAEPKPSIPSMAILSEEIERRMADVSETDPGKVAALTQDAVEDFIDAWVDRPADDPVDWDGCPVTAATLAGVLLGEVVMHGYDMAYALGRPWPIDPNHAGLILGAYGPLFPLIVDAEAAKGHTAGYALDFGGGPVLTVRFTDGVIGLEPPGMGPVDVTLCSDPVTFLMVADGRLSQYEAIALGRMSATGDRPELAVGFKDLFVDP
ncbi:MAG TPA: maleylpyruvate isomerase family mycothiol-dependent enzyme [Acidimicrobiia bacterium]|jgi:uncharacterized protein (TIGR03083 family)|nr:maleylpyruvate isomerase family mycothiol-dependent enzyme [Acidimicrobiia bacterium]